MNYYSKKLYERATSMPLSQLRRLIS